MKPSSQIQKSSKVDVLNSVTYLNRTPIFEWYVIRCGSENKHQKDMCLKKEWTTRSKHVNHLELNSQYNWRRPTWPFNKHENLHFDNE